MRALVIGLALSGCIVVPIPIPVGTMSAPQVRNLSAVAAPDAAFDAQLKTADCL